VNHQTALFATLCQALIAHDACATVVVDLDERLVAWNDAACAAFGFDPEHLRSGSLALAALIPGGSALRDPIETIRTKGGLQPHRVELPDGEITLAALRVDGRLEGFVLRRADAAAAEALVAELGVLRAELEATRADLQTSSAEIATANEALRAANEDLQRRLDELLEAEIADRHKNEFLAMIAHELRTPLAPILSAVQILGRQAADNPLVQRAREVVERQALHQARLLDDLLDVSRITRGKIELRRRNLDLSTALNDVVEATRPLINAKAQTISVTLPEQPVFVDADPTRLTQILSNLLNNAAKYTHAGGRIAVGCRRDGEHAVVVVRDNGVGIPREMLSRIFDLFAQAEPLTARTQGGLGIGLTLVKSLVEMHGGTVVARSGGRGTGSEFEVRLPAVAAPNADALPSPGTVPARSRRVLIVEDNVDTREMLRRVLELDGHEVQEAADGAQGVEMALATRPEVVIVDIGLPRLDGYQVARRLRAGLGTAPLLIAVTGYGQTEDRRLSRDAGFDVHLVKPVAPDQLAAALYSRDAGEAA
jgi:signal transduction histidine kinase/ActR/RegA family two-component response regulator